MALITRLSRLFKADVHAVLDQIEEPEVLLRQAIREMDEVISQDEQRLKRIQSGQRQTESRQQQIRQQLEEIETQLDVCFGSDEEDLARTLIKRKLEVIQQNKLLIAEHTNAQQAMQDLKSVLDERRQTLHSMQQKARLLVRESNSVEQVNEWHANTLSVCDEDVEVAFLQEKKRRANA